MKLISALRRQSRGRLLLVQKLEPAFKSRIGKVPLKISSLFCLMNGGARPINHRTSTTNQTGLVSMHIIGQFLWFLFSKVKSIGAWCLTYVLQICYLIGYQSSKILCLALSSRSIYEKFQSLLFSKTNKQTKTVSSHIQWERSRTSDCTRYDSVPNKNLPDGDASSLATPGRGCWFAERRRLIHDCLLYASGNIEHLPRLLYREEKETSPKKGKKKGFPVFEGTVLAEHFPRLEWKKRCCH